VIEACEHKEHFLEYTPSVLVITNIEYDHADYFKTPESYIEAFQKMISKVVPGGFVILSTDDPNSQKLL
jgi:UDP-N-acetylmuramate--alanine ligase